MTIKLLFLAGSLREQSFNKKLANVACEISKQQGIDSHLIDLKDYPMPIYDADIEAQDGMPESAKKLKQLFIETDGFFIASPEYNSSMSSVLKNTIDWLSRPSKANSDEPPLVAFDYKVAAICAASPGTLGGLRGLVPLRMLLSNIRVHVIPEQYALSAAADAFDESGEFVNNDQRKMLENVVTAFVSTTQKLKG